VGRGSSDDKGLVLGWLGVLQWYYEHKKEMPVNLVVSSSLFSISTLDFILDYLLVILLLMFWVQSDNYWLNTRTPALPNIKRRRKY
jgi:hypothetical protein